MLAIVAQEIVNAVVEQAADDLNLLKALRATSSIFQHASTLTFVRCRLPVADNHLEHLLSLIYDRPFLVRYARHLCLVPATGVAAPPVVAHDDLVVLLRLAPRLKNLELGEFDFMLSAALPNMHTIMALTLTDITRIVEDNVIVDYVAEDLVTTTPEGNDALFPAPGPLRLRHRTVVTGHSIPPPRPSTTWFFGGDNLLPTVSRGMRIAFVAFRDTLKVVFLDIALYPYATTEWHLLGMDVAFRLRVVNLRINLHTFNRHLNSAQGFNMNQVLTTLPDSITHIALQFAYAYADSPAFSAHIAEMDWAAIGVSLQRLPNLRVIAINLCSRGLGTQWRPVHSEHIERTLRVVLLPSVTVLFLHPAVTGELKKTAVWAMATSSMSMDISGMKGIL